MIRIGLIGTGGIALANHLPGVGRCGDARVTALCDSNPQVLAEASRVSGIERTFADPHALIAAGEVDAVIIATPNRSHHPIATEAIAAGLHVLCEKPLALTVAEAREMAEAADHAGVRHMTAFTYRFVPAMRYVKHLVSQGFVGEPWHFRAQRFQDWGRRALGWRQRLVDAGSGEVGDMLSHRIDYGHLLVGPIVRVMAQTQLLVPSRVDAQGQEHPADAEDWVGCLATFASGASGVLESTKVATGRGEGGRSHDYCEVNGPEGTLVYELAHPQRILTARRGGSGLDEVPVPAEWLTYSGAALEAGVDPQQAFRWDQNVEFVSAIREGRPCTPSFHDGVRVQEVMEAVARSAREGRQIDVGAPQG
jgi:predicted dehydrogenase